MSASLPIAEIRPTLSQAITREGMNRFVVTAPTGSGKSTQVPQYLLDDLAIPRTGKIIILQPRRIAARMLAARVAQERQTRLGDSVGYQVRFDNRTSTDTRIIYQTEGILLRRMLEDPDLHGVAAILFDEFHERHLYGDVTLARAVALQARSRKDLIIGVMSATLDTGPLEQYLQPCCMIRSEGRTFPVNISYSANPKQIADKPVWDQAAWHFNRMAREENSGDFLIFMPGVWEIRKTMEAIAQYPVGREFKILPLYGDLPPEEQDKVMSRFEKRKVIVATNAAETSITIDGVRHVIDSGLARIPEFDPHRGVNTLLVQKISQASADQRSGRAGRTAPGTCLRMWGEREHQYRAPYLAPEIQRLDLAEIILTLKAGRVDDINSINWFEPPDEKSSTRALMLLRELHAIEGETAPITGLGRKMAAFPLHPRHSRMMIEAADRYCLPTMALVLAIMQGRPLLLPLRNSREEDKRTEMLGADQTGNDSDLFYSLKAWQFAASNRYSSKECRDWGIHAQASRQAAQLADQLIKISKNQQLNCEEYPNGLWTNIKKSLLSGFSDQVARRLDRASLRCALVNNRRGELRRNSVVRKAELLISTDIEERNHRGTVTVFLGENTAIEETWLLEQFRDEFNETSEVFYCPRQKRVTAVRRRQFRDLVLEENAEEDPDPEESARILARAVNEGELKIRKWDRNVDIWINRVNVLARYCPEYEISTINIEDRLFLLEQICHGAYTAKGVRDREVWPVLKSWLTTEQKPLLDLLVPERIKLPSGVGAPIRYDDPSGQPVLSATVQALYEAPGKIFIADGRAPLLFEILAPNRRPVQITDDLDAFWANSYQEVKKQLKGRYPRHKWK